MSASPAVIAAAQAAGVDPEVASAEIKRLLARGSDIELANGDVVTLVYTARMLARIEVEYGSLNAYLADVQLGTGGRIFHALAFTLGLALRQPVDRVWDLIDTRRLADYVSGMGAALLEAMPPQEAAAGNGGGPTTAPSPGDDSSTSPWSTGTSRQPTSGI